MALLRRKNDARQKAVMSGSLCKVRTSSAARRGGERDTISLFKRCKSPEQEESVVTFNSSDACCIKNERLSVCIEVEPRAHHKKSKAPTARIFFLSREGNSIATGRPRG
jgi:hypothetical protein